MYYRRKISNTFQYIGKKNFFEAVCDFCTQMCSSKPTYMSLFLMLKFSFHGIQYIKCCLTPTSLIEQNFFPFFHLKRILLWNLFLLVYGLPSLHHSHTSALDLAILLLHAWIKVLNSLGRFSAQADGLSPNLAQQNEVVLCLSTISDTQRLQFCLLLHIQVLTTAGLSYKNLRVQVAYYIHAKTGKFNLCIRKKPNLKLHSFFSKPWVLLRYQFFSTASEGILWVSGNTIVINKRTISLVLKILNVKQ